MMETGTFLKENVRSHIEKYFIPVKYDSGMDLEPFHRFNVNATPTYVIFDSKGKEIKRLLGFYSPDELIEQFESAGAGGKELA